MAEVGVTQAWLRSSWHVEVPRSWLDACVEWVMEEAGGVNVPQTQLNQQVLDQWILTDLRDLAYPVLPAGVSEARKSELNGIYCLQMDSLLDVSQPAYSQLQRVRGTDCTNEQVTAVTQATQKPWEAKPTRMLMLQLTDGVQSLEGMEYQPIPALCSNLPPGTKLQLVGKVAVRLGVLLLKSENVRVLGGEVEALVERHSQRKVLCRALGLPEEEHAQEAEPDDLELLASVEAMGEHHDGGRTGGTLDSGYVTNQSSLDSQASHRMGPPHGHQLDPSSIGLSIETNTVSQQSDVVEIPDEDFDDIPDNFDIEPEDFPDEPNNALEDFDDIPVDELDCMMLPADEELTPSNDTLEPDNMEQPVSIPDQVRSTSQARQINRPRMGGSDCLNVSKTSHTEKDGHYGVFAAQTPVTSAADDSFSSPEPKIARYEPTSSGTQIGAGVSAQEHSRAVNADTSILNYLCILQAGEWPPSSSQTVRLQAFIVTLVGSLRSSGGEWKVAATISDGSGNLDVDLSDALLTRLIGFSASESRALRKDPAKRGAVDAGIQNCQKALVDMCCVMSIRLDTTGRGLVLTADPLTEREFCELQRRVTEKRS